MYIGNLFKNLFYFKHAPSNESINEDDSKKEKPSVRFLGDGKY